MQVRQDDGKDDLRWDFISGLAVPKPGDSRPDFPVPDIIVLDGHTVPSEISEAFDPCVLKCWNGLVEESHHGIGDIYEGQHVLQRIG